MNSSYSPIEGNSKSYKTKNKWHASRIKRSDGSEAGFLCCHCHAYVSSAEFLSRVHNRNHCPYCLWSRHLDLYDPGDRLSACKSTMMPIGLTVKLIAKKYGEGFGELMLVHSCSDCGHHSINRIAADDDSDLLLELFEASIRLKSNERRLLKLEGIEVLNGSQKKLVQAQLIRY
jgi:hypothetical protein